MGKECLLFCDDRPIPYAVAWEWQKSLVTARKADPTLSDVLLLVEHLPVYTLGQGGKLAHLKEISSFWRVERGGEATYHAPGQLVGYPILNLNYHQRDLHWYLRQLEETLLKTLAKLNIRGERLPGLTGVWVKGKKVGQIGIKVTRWLTMHGFALNVNTDLSGFAAIVPCGIPNCQCANINDFLGTPVSLAEVRLIVVQSFAEVFGVSYTTLPQQEISNHL